MRLLSGSISFSAQVVTHQLAVADRNAEREVELSSRQSAECKAAYIRVLAISRQLRYLARNPRQAGVDQVDSLKVQLSAAYYEIMNFSHDAVAAQASQVIHSSIDYLDPPRVMPPIGQLETDSPRSFRRSARQRGRPPATSSTWHASTWTTTTAAASPSCERFLIEIVPS